MRASLLNHRYLILKALGEGGFGKTFLAEDMHMPSKRRCVIKQLKPLNNQPATFAFIQQRFDREAAVLESVSKANDQVPDLYAYFSENGQFYLVQEWIDGKPLTPSPVWSEAKVVTFLKAILPAIAQVHRQNIIHRDIKPDNIILRQADRQPCLIDFGAVKELMNTVLPSGSKESSIVIGTPGFMPAEQAAGRPVFASDLYSLGITGIYLLTGRSPHEIPIDNRTGQLLWQQFAPAVGDRTAAILTRTVNPHAQNRYATAEDLLDILLDSPVPASTPSVPLQIPPTTPSKETIVVQKEATSEKPQPTIVSADKTSTERRLRTMVVGIGAIASATVVVAFAVNGRPRLDDAIASNEEAADIEEVQQSPTDSSSSVVSSVDSSDLVDADSEELSPETVSSEGPLGKAIRIQERTLGYLTEERLKEKAIQQEDSEGEPSLTEMTLYIAHLKKVVQRDPIAESALAFSYRERARALYSRGISTLALEDLNNALYFTSPSLEEEELRDEIIAELDLEKVQSPSIAFSDPVDGDRRTVSSSYTEREKAIKAHEKELENMSEEAVEEIKYAPVDGPTPSPSAPRTPLKMAAEVVFFKNKVEQGDASEQFLASIYVRRARELYKEGSSKLALEDANNALALVLRDYEARVVRKRILSGQ